MKITTWNVNGLRSVLSKNAFDWTPVTSPDVICLQEIKAKPEQVEISSVQSLSDYLYYWNPAQRAGYSGVVTFSKSQPETVQIEIGVKKFDVEGRVVVTTHSDLMLINAYFPNGKRDHERLDYKLEFYSVLLDFCDWKRGEGYKIILCGDFNTAHQEIDLRNPRQNRNTSGFLPEERAWVDRYLQNGFVDAYRELYPQRIQYTWWTYRYKARERNIGWRLDYFLITEELMPRVKDVVIHESILGSDHCPVSLIIA